MRIHEIAYRGGGVDASVVYGFEEESTFETDACFDHKPAYVEESNILECN